MSIPLLLAIQTHHADNLLELVITLLQVIYSFGVLLLACELGQRVTITFDECTALIDNFDWYLFPIEIQRMLTIVINFAQQPLVVKCFGSAACDRETFKYVSIRTIYNGIRGSQNVKQNEIFVFLWPPSHGTVRIKGVSNMFCNL